ncbi:solute carrier family 13 member 2-like isoform X2 [Ostrea edulis]|nr:solute carrier family 13 member 2-like isoform X2 [Ostrea edulis]
MLFLGGLLIAVAMEEVNLHRRIAVGVMRVLGSRVNTLMLGLMAPTWFLSMWISNTAATSMMLPILVAITEQMEKLEKEQLYGEEEAVKEKNGDASPGMIKIDVEDDATVREKTNELKQMTKGFALCVAYGANIGGIATLTGTPPNLVLQGQADIYYTKYGNTTSPITYVNWLGFAFPLSLLLLLLGWIYLQIIFLRGRCCRGTEKSRKLALQSAINKQWKALGDVKFAEIEVLALFCVLALLWVFRSIPNVGGWGDIFTDVATGKIKTARDSTASIFVAILLFILPKEVPSIFCWFQESETNVRPNYQPILTWHSIQQKVAWGVLFLLGGGFALADAATKSGLSSLIGCELRVFKEADPWVMTMLVCLLVACITEITSNTAIASLMMPIVFELAISVGQHPLYLMIPTAVATSFAFCLPVATPPNAIVFSSGYITIPDMCKAGLFMNIIALSVITLAINTWGQSIFNLDTTPAYFSSIAAAGTCGTVVVTTTETYNATTLSMDSTSV